jgi:pheromone shutdown protein TraB
LLLQEPFILAAFRYVRGWSPALGRLTRLLVDERNEAAIGVFDGTPSDQDILFIYGAGHIPGLLVALERRGYRETARDWFTAHTERIAFSDVFDTAAGVWRWANGRGSGIGGRGSAAGGRRSGAGGRARP